MASRMVTVLSPHLDDAVLSCWHLLTASDPAGVVNVFGGTPPPGIPLPRWDRITRASDSAARMAERREEDRAAMALAGVEAVTLDLLELQYRANGRPAPNVLARVRESLGAAPVVYAPAGLGTGHPDHLLVRDAALRLRAEGLDVRLYADLPHANVLGWPDWVGAEQLDPVLDISEWWSWSLQTAGLSPAGLEPELHALDDEAFGRKLEAVRAYRTQVPALERIAPLDQLRHEVTWRLGEAAAR